MYISVYRLLYRLDYCQSEYGIHFLYYTVYTLTVVKIDYYKYVIMCVCMRRKSRHTCMHACIHTYIYMYNIYLYNVNLKKYQIVAIRFVGSMDTENIF